MNDNLFLEQFVVHSVPSNIFAQYLNIFLDSIYRETAPKTLSMYLSIINSNKNERQLTFVFGSFR